MKKKTLLVVASMMITTALWAQTENKTFTVNGVGFKMIKVEGGTFEMGMVDEWTANYSSFRDNEVPFHNVTLSDYFIGETEVTQALWRAVMGSLPLPLRSAAVNHDVIGDQRPVFSSWEECQEFVRRLNAKTGMRFRFPTEAEWEFAARGGRKSRGYKYSGSNTLKNVAWYDGYWNEDIDGTYNVKTKAANELGLYDMSGNVYEWCQDWYGEYSRNAQANPKGPTSGSHHVARGGDWSDEWFWCRVSARNPVPRGMPGLRLALSK